MLMTAVLFTASVGATSSTHTLLAATANDCDTDQTFVPNATGSTDGTCKGGGGSLNLKENIGCGSDFDTTNIDSGMGCVSASDGSELSKTIKTILNVFSWVVGVASVIMIIFAGFKYVISQGSSEGVSGARNTILYAIIGLVVVALAQTIVRFVIGKL